MKPLNSRTTILISSNMAIEIQELHIRINVEEEPAGQGTTESRSEEREQVVADVVEKVMEILSKKEER